MFPLKINVIFTVYDDIKAAKASGGQAAVSNKPVRTLSKLPPRSQVKDRSGVEQNGGYVPDVSVEFYLFRV